MASSLYFIVVLCLTSGLWIGANADTEFESDVCCDDCKTCPPGWTQFGDHCYKYQHAGKDWADAELACIDEGGNLASINSQAVYDFVREMIKSATAKDERVWIGGHDTAKEGVWLWTDGTKFEFGHWPANEPSNGGKREHCLELNYQSKPNDVGCSAAKPYVCGKRL